MELDPVLVVTSYLPTLCGVPFDLGFEKGEVAVGEVAEAD